MNMKRPLIAFLILCGLAIPAVLAAPAKSTVTLSGVHLCCGSCVKGVSTALMHIKDATATCDQTAGTIVLTAPDKDTLQKAVNSLTDNGYFGKSSDDAIKVDATTGAKDGKVQTLVIADVHLCCGSCVTAVKEVLSKVDGVKDNTVKAKATSFTVTGNFEPKALFAELQKAGLTGKVATPK